MRLLKTILLLVIVLSSMIACNNPETTTVTDPAITTTTDDTTTPETIEPLPSEPAPIVEIEGNRTTLEGFWAMVLTAVANKDKETLKLLSAYRAGATGLTEDHYAPLVAKIKATDFKESPRKENGKKLYEYMISMNYEDVLEENQPSTTIYIWKKEDGNFEIFNLFEAG